MRNMKIFGVNIFWHILFLALAAVFITPILWMMSTAFKTSREIFAVNINFIPREITLENFIDLHERFDILRIIFNTLVVALGLTFTRTFSGLLAAYGFARFDFPFKKIFFFLCIVTLFVPIQVVMVSNYILVSNMGLVNNYLGVILPQFAHAFPLFLLYQHLKRFPEEIIDSARIDGAGEITTLFKIIIPGIKPVLTATAIIVFINSWNQYVWPTIILRDPQYMTLPIWLRQFMHAEAGLDWGLLMAASLIGVVPVLFLYITANKKIIDTFAGTGVKG